MEQTDQNFSQIYARLLSWLDPDPVRSEQALRAIQNAIRRPEAEPEKKPLRQ